MEYVMMLLKWTVEFVASLIGLMLLLIILLLILVACNVYGLIELVSKYTKKLMIRFEDETPEVEEEETEE